MLRQQAQQTLGTQLTDESLQCICQSLLTVGINIIILWSNSNYGGSRL
ncbi:MAG TPA: hypothetical protein VI037_07880 [Nitrososphaera sp.]